MIKKALTGLTLIAVTMLSCKKKQNIDLAKLSLNEKAADIINYDENYSGGVNTVEAPFSFALEASKSTSLLFNGLKIDTAAILFQLRSDKIRKDTSLYQGGGRIDEQNISNRGALRHTLEKFDADSLIYGYRLRIKTKELQAAILKQLVTLYGPGTKNPNTDHGFYWNLKSLHRYIFFAPDYDVLIVVDNSKISKNCFWDLSTGSIDFGGCDINQYTKSLFK